MLFVVKKIAGAVLMPLPVATCVLIAFLFCRLLVKKKRWAAFSLVLFVVLFLAQTTVFVPRLLLSPLEQRYPVFQRGQLPHAYNAGADPFYIVVLGGGQVVNDRIPAAARLNYSSLARVVEGIRLSRLYPEATLLFSGGRVFDEKPVAATMAAAAWEMGVDPERISEETESRDTGEQARVLSQRLGLAPFLLVTSASHMPRAMKLFATYGSNPVPAPCGHLIKRPGGGLSWHDLLPQASNVRMMERAIHEWLGLAWLSISDSTYEP